MLFILKAITPLPNARNFVSFKSILREEEEDGGEECLRAKAKEELKATPRTRGFHHETKANKEKEKANRSHWAPANLSSPELAVTVASSVTWPATAINDKTKYHQPLNKTPSPSLKNYQYLSPSTRNLS